MTQKQHKPIDIVFEDYNDVKEWIAGLPEQMQEPVHAVYAAGVYHATQGIVAAVDVTEDPHFHLEENSSVN